jgi:CRP/FNR family cyclic AMP-dependent transcriptional regulator
MHLRADHAELRTVLQRLLPQMGFDESAIDLLVQRIRLVSCRADERIVSPNDRDDLVHLVVRGSVRLVCNVPGRPPTVVNLLGPGRFFGLASLFDRPGPRLFGAVAHESCVVGNVSQSVATEAIAGLAPERAARFLAYSWRILSSIIYHKSRALALPVSERLLVELRLLSCDFGKPDPRGLLIDVPLRQADLAALVGSSRPNVSRALETLRRAALIDVAQGRLLLLDPSPGPCAELTPSSPRL